MPEKICPHCGRAIHEAASFCPYCAQPVNIREEVHPPRHMPWRALCSALIAVIALVLVLAAAGWFHTRPRIYDDNGTAEVIYTDRGVDYQLCVAWPNEPFTPARQRYDSGAMDEEYRYPVLLYVNLADGSAHAADAFLERVDHITAQVTALGKGLQMTCSQPTHDTDYVPNTAAIVYINYITTEFGQHSAELTISVQMKNGDVIHLHQQQIIETSRTYDYTPDDTPMDTVQDLEALLEIIQQTAEPDDQVNVYLPPVTYDAELVLDGKPIHFIGSQDESGNRTTFTRPVTVTAQNGWLYIFDHIDFAGPGDGTGLSISARTHLNGCRISGWDTGVLAHTNAWVNLDECVLEDNGTGFHFNAAMGHPSDTRYMDNLFVNNDTAVLLELVPNQVSLKFPGTRFEGNGTDIDNRCGQALELDGAVFK